MDGCISCSSKVGPVSDDSDTSLDVPASNTLTNKHVQDVHAPPPGGSRLKSVQVPVSSDSFSTPHSTSSVYSDPGSEDEDKTLESSLPVSRSTSTVLSIHESSSSGSLISQNSQELDAVLDQCRCSADESFDATVDNISAQSLKLRRKFEQRDRSLRNISKVESKAYLKYLSTQEEFVRAQERNVIEMRRLSSASRKSPGAPAEAACAAACAAASFDTDETHLCSLSTTSNSRKIPAEITIKKVREPLISSDSTPSPEASSSWGHTLRRLLCFEKYHSVPGVFALLLYCVAHLTLYEALWNTHGQIFSRFEAETAVHACTLVVGLLLTRLSGGLFYWLTDDLFSGVKFDLHNKLRLHDLDARILHWMRKHPALRQFIDWLGLYLCFVAVGHVIDDLIVPMFCDIREDLHEDLPSHAYENIRTQAKMKLTRLKCDGEYIFDEEGWDEWYSRCIDDSVCCVPSDQLRALLELEDEDFLYSRLSHASFYSLLGWSGSAVNTAACLIFCHGMMASISILLLIRLGINFNGID